MAKQKIIAPEGNFCWQNTINLYIHLHHGAFSGERDRWDKTAVWQKSISLRELETKLN